MKFLPMACEYESHGGDDLLVVNAARSSFGRRSTYQDDGTLSEGDQKLLLFLARGMSTKERDESCAQFAEHTEFGRIQEAWDLAAAFHKSPAHELPFRHPQLTLRCRAPLFIARQLGKHQVGLSWSETSRRYISEGLSFWRPESWRARPEGGIKQGSGEAISHAENVECDQALAAVVASSLACYEHLLQLGVAPEQARMVLPQNMHVEWVWTGSLLAWVHLVRLRRHSHAQREVQDFAELVENHLREIFPYSSLALLGPHD